MRIWSNKAKDPVRSWWPLLTSRSNFNNDIGAIYISETPLLRHNHGNLRQAQHSSGRRIGDSSKRARTLSVTNTMLRLTKRCGAVWWWWWWQNPHRTGSKPRIATSRYSREGFRAIFGRRGKPGGFLATDAKEGINKASAGQPVRVHVGRRENGNGSRQEPWMVIHIC